MSANSSNNNSDSNMRSNSSNTAESEAEANTQSSDTTKSKPILGKNVSGRVWKQPKKRFKSTHYQPQGARLSYEERMARKREQEEVRRLAEELKQEKEREREELRERLRKKREREQQRLWELKQKELLLQGTLKKKPGRNKMLKPKQLRQARMIANNWVNPRDIA